MRDDEVIAACGIFAKKHNTSLDLESLHCLWQDKDFLQHSICDSTHLFATIIARFSLKGHLWNFLAFVGFASLILIVYLLLRDKTTPSVAFIIVSEVSAIALVLLETNFHLGIGSLLKEKFDIAYFAKMENPVLTLMRSNISFGKESATAPQNYHQHRGKRNLTSINPDSNHGACFGFRNCDSPRKTINPKRSGKHRRK